MDRAEGGIEGGATARGGVSMKATHGYTRFDFRCPQCRQTFLNVRGHIGVLPDVQCLACDLPMQRYYGTTQGDQIVTNYGFRPHHHDDIAQFQFENL